MNLPTYGRLQRKLQATGPRRLLFELALFGCVLFLGSLLLHDPESSTPAEQGKPGTDSPASPLLESNSAGGSCGVPDAGAIPGQPSVIWCYPQLDSGNGTHVEEANSWFDNFDHGLSFAACCPGYRVFESVGGGRSLHWRHANHWMVDLASEGDCCSGAIMRPDRSFTFEGGKLVLEFEAAAGVLAYGKDTWIEVGVTAAPQPLPDPVDILYAYGQFRGYWTMGCRLAPGSFELQAGSLTCAVESSATNIGQDQGCSSFGPSRTIEISGHQPCGSIHWSYDQHPESRQAFRKCQDTDPDSNCRDLFRVEFYKDGVVVFVNGVKYFEDKGWPVNKQLPDSFLSGPVYPYFGQWQVRDEGINRYHWDSLSINP